MADREAVDEFEVRGHSGADPTWAVLAALQREFQGRSAVLTAFTPINPLKLMSHWLKLWTKVFEASGEGIVINDAEHHVRTANRAFRRSTGYERHELIGEAVGACGQWQGGAALPVFGPALAPGNNWQGEVTLQRREGGNAPPV